MKDISRISGRFSGTGVLGTGLLAAFFQVLLLTLVGAALLSACSGNKAEEDPLKNSRKVIPQGHRSLYENGAFTIPYTTVKLIPPGPTVEELAFSQAGVNARQAFLQNLDAAKRATEIVVDGTKYSYEVARKINKGTTDVIAAIHAHSRPGAKMIGYKSYLRDKGIRGKTWEAGRAAGGAVEQAGASTARGALKAGGKQADTGAEWVKGSPALAGAILSKSVGYGKAVGKGLDASAKSMGRFLSVSGDSIIIKSKSRFNAIPDSALRIYRGAAGAGETLGNSTAGAGRTLAQGGARVGDAMTDSGSAIASRSVDVGVSQYKGITKQGDRLAKSMTSGAESLSRASSQAGDKLMESGTQEGAQTVRSSLSEAGQSGGEGMAAMSKGMQVAGSEFIIGYSAVPARLSQRASEASSNIGGDLDSGADERGKSGNWRARQSDRFAVMMQDTVNNYGSNVELKFSKSRKVFNKNLKTSGYTLAALKSLRWQVEALLWDGVIKPLGKLTGGMLGYLTVNGVAYPALLTYDTTTTVANVAVEVTKGAALGSYDLVAPTGAASLTAMMSLGNGIVGLGKAAGQGTGGTLLGGGEIALGNLAGVSVKYGGMATGASIKYIAVPLAQAGMVTTGAVAGAVTGTGMAVGGGSLMLAGQTLKGTAKGTGWAMEYGLAPLAKGAVKTGGVVAATGKGAFDALTGTTLYLTGGALKGTALLTENAIKYGVSPLAQGTTVASGAVVVAGGGASKAVGGTAVYLWGRTVQGAGYLSGKVVQHAGAPVTKASIIATGAVAGKTVRGAGLIAQGATYAAGEIAAGATWIFGNTIAAGTLAGGTAGSVVYGSAVGLYEIGSAITVPVGHIGGAGVVLSYKSLAHLGAHSVLAVSDAAYLVLSLEGPRWVIYAVQGKLGDGENLKPGTVLDLKKMQENKEVFYNVPVSQEEITGVVNSITEELPQAQPE